MCKFPAIYQKTNFKKFFEAYFNHPGTAICTYPSWNSVSEVTHIIRKCTITVSYALNLFSLSRLTILR